MASINAVTPLPTLDPLPPLRPRCKPSEVPLDPRLSALFWFQPPCRPTPLTSSSVIRPPTKIALVGCGALTELYYRPALAALMAAEPLKVTALVDPNPARIGVLAPAFPDAGKFSDVTAITPQVADVAIVASPQRFHAAQAIALLRAGVHVLCEKPMTSTVEEAREMVAVAEQSRRLLSVGLFRRFFPSSQTVKELVTGGALGRPLNFEWAEGGPFNWPAASPSFFQKSSSPGGVFADVGAHVLDLLLWWFGEVDSFDYEDDAVGGIEANARLRLRFKGGVAGSLRLSRDTAIPNGTRIRFERGSVWFQGASAESVVIQLDGCTHVAKAVLHETPAAGAGIEIGAGVAGRTYAQSFMGQILNLCRAIRGEEPLRVPGSEAARGMALIEACYATRRVMPMPWLTPAEQAGVTRLTARK